ncbi:ACSL [Acanthosepion pharaonis]|uniref:ACSL n=1 Tax=Acanthosepion pharaonis TaxID=158019 RepID=A0A812BK10_ACAPH|nr:ACSL [Sepia pharaonis]
MFSPHSMNNVFPIRVIVLGFLLSTHIHADCVVQSGLIDFFFLIYDFFLKRRLKLKTTCSISFFIGFLKAIAYVYDVVAFVPYYMICKPYEKVRLSKRIKAKPIGNDANSPYRSVECSGGELSTALFGDECVTVDDLFVRAVRLYGPRPCLGTREILQVEDEQQQNGRVFQKVGRYKVSSF